MRKKWIWGIAPLVLAAMWFTNNSRMESEDKAQLVPYQPMVSDTPTVAIEKGKSDEYTKTTIAAIRESGGLEGLVKKGSTVYIKPNIVGPSPSGAGRITDYRVVQAVIYECKRLGAARVVVGEAPVDCSWEEGFAIASYDKLTGAELMDTNTSKADSYYRIPERSLIGQPLYVPKIYLDADVVIDVPILKTHFNAGVTLGLKNVGIGMPPLKIYNVGGNKGALHNFDIFKEIPDVSSIRRPDYTVIDGMVGGEGVGPTEPTPVESGLVIAGRDIVAVDTVGTLVMGYDPYDISYLVNAAAMSRLGVMDISKIRVVGKSIAEVQQNFERPPENGYPFKHTTVAREATVPIKVDGDLTDWKDMWPNYIQNPSQFQGDNWKGADDLKAVTYVAHDWKNVYAAYDITDDAVTAGDSTELSLSFNMKFDPARVRHKRVKGRDFLLVATPTQDGGITVVDQVTGEPLQGITAATLKTAKGYTVELSIPVESLGLKDWKLRSEFWIDFGIKDADTVDGVVKTHATWSAPWKTPTWSATDFNDPSNAGRATVDAIKYPWEG